MYNFNNAEESAADGSRISRRSFIQRVAFIPVLAAGAAGVMAGCGGKEAETESALATCENYEGLSEQDLNLRKTFNYVSNSPNANQVCSNCALYVTPEAGGTCGGCQLFKGPVNPGGYCTSWAQKQA